MDLNEAARRAAWELLVDLRTMVLPSAAGEMYEGERRDELAKICSLADEAGPWLAGALPGLTDTIRRAAETLLANPDDDKSWMELADARVTLTEQLGTAI